MIHNTVGAIVKTNIVKSNNERDLGVAYLLASLIYGSIGVFGAFGLLVFNGIYFRVKILLTQKQY